jgi:protein-S-isoprenylcysteine O-methyltransferase Ste14
VTKAFAGLAFLLAVLGAALFAPAWTLAYWQAWVFLGVFASATIAITIDLAVRDPALLARRVQAGPVAERQRVQQVIQSIASLAFLAIFVIASLAHRGVPVGIVIAGDVLVALGLGAVALVFRANTFTSAVIDIEQGQQVVSTGPYAIVRHPMYAGALVMLIGVPLALGSWWAFVPVSVLAAVIVWRLLDEETLLARELAGYDDYRRKVRRRLVPGVW